MEFLKKKIYIADTPIKNEIKTLKDLLTNQTVYTKINQLQTDQTYLLVYFETDISCWRSSSHSATSWTFLLGYCTVNAHMTWRPKRQCFCLHQYGGVGGATNSLQSKLSSHSDCGVEKEKRKSSCTLQPNWSIEMISLVHGQFCWNRWWNHGAQSYTFTVRETCVIYFSQV